MSIMLIDFNDQFLIDVAQDLVRNNINVSYSLTDAFKTYKENKLLRKIKIIDGNLFFYPKNINKLRLDKSIISAEFFNNFTQCENLFLIISDRLCFFPIPVRTRKNIFQKLLIYWYSFLKNSDINTIIFASTPHLGFHNIIYCVAKKLNIKTIYIQRTLINNRIALLTDYNRYDKVPQKFLQNLNRSDLIDYIGKNNYQELFVQSSWIQRSNFLNKRAINQGILFNIKEYIAAFIRFIHFIFQGVSTSVFYLNNGCNKIIIGIICLFMNIKMKLLRNYYESLISKINYQNKYVYFALHFQPERSTVPEGGVFENQLLAIDILSLSVPNDWLIYVKEHPRQFENNDPRRRHYRNQYYYDEILSHKNVRLVSIKEDSDRLINNAVFTSTITGSAGWQSLLVSKPCITFGVPWYAACSSCYAVNSVSECKKAINEILHKSKKAVAMDLLRFIAYVNDKFVISSNDYWHAKNSTLSYHTLVDNMANNLIKYCHKYV